MYVKEDLRVVDDGIMLILELKPENEYRRIHFFLVSVRYGIVSWIYKVFLTISRHEMAQFSMQLSIWKWHTLGDACNFRDRL